MLWGLLAIACLVAAPGPAHAQDLIIVTRGKTIWRVDVSTMQQTVIPIVGLPAEHEILGVARLWSNLPPHEERYHVASGLYGYDEQLQIHNLDIVGGVVGGLTCNINGGTSFALSDLVQISYPGTSPNQLSSLTARDALVDTQGRLYQPSCSPTVSPFFTLPGNYPGSSTAFNGTVVGASTWGGSGHLYLAKEGTLTSGGGKLTGLYRIEDIYPSSPAAVTAEWPLLGFGSQLLGMTVANTGELYALVNQPTSCLGHGHGHVVLKRSTTTLSAPSLQLEQVGPAISSWVNASGAGCLEFPTSFIFFEDKAPVGLSLSGPTDVLGCDQGSLTASWGSGPTTGMVSFLDELGQPVEVTVTNGGTMPIDQGTGRTVTYTLTVVGFTGKTSTTSHVVVSDGLVLTSAPSGQIGPFCPGEEGVSLLAQAAGYKLPVTYELWKVVAVGAETLVASFEDSDPKTAGEHWFVFAVFTPIDEGYYYVRVSDACGHGEQSEPFHVGLAVEASIVAEPGSPLEVCTGAAWSFEFDVAGSPKVEYELHRLILGGTESVTSGETSLTKLVIPMAPITATTFYRLEVWNDCNDSNVVSANLEAKVLTPPTMDEPPPVAVQVYTGGTLSVSALATGDAPLAYVWTRGEVKVGQGATLILGDVDSGDSGIYRVTVSNAASSICNVVAFAETAVTVVGAPTGLTVSQGTSSDHVLVTWDAVPGALSYRVLRADLPGDLGKGPVSAWIPGTSFADETAIPGHVYSYSVRAGLGEEGGDECQESEQHAGWRALTPPGLTMSYTFPANHAVASWNEPPGAGYYQVWRRSVPVAPGDPVAVSDWISATTLNVTGSAFQSYEFRVVAAVDDEGTRPSAPSNWDSQSMPCQQPGLNCPNPEGPGLLVLIDRSRHMDRSAGLGTRWGEALEYAAQEIAAFSSHCPQGVVAIWTFAGDCVEDRTIGYVPAGEALAILATLPISPHPVLGAPLAKALCDSIWSLCLCIQPGCSIPTSHGPKQKIVLVLSAGVNDGSLYPSFCDGPPSTSGSNCTSDPYLPGDSWERKVCTLLSSLCVTVYALIWDEPIVPLTSGPPPALAAFAAASGGEARVVLDGDPLPFPFFGDCNGNGVPDALDLLAGTSLDCNGDGIPDECQGQLDCNGNGVPDPCDLASGFSRDQNGNGRPDECEGFAFTGPTLPLAGVYNEFHLVGGTPFGIGAVLLAFPSQSSGVQIQPKGFSPTGTGSATSGGSWRMVSFDEHGYARIPLQIPSEVAGLTMTVAGWEVRPMHRGTQLLEVIFR